MRKLTKLAAVAAFTLSAQTAMAIPINLAPGGTASQSSTGFGGDANRAIDGNTDGRYFAGSVTHTNDGDFSPSWQVDLGDAFAIGQITIWNRTDCCANRLDAVLTILDASMNVLFTDTFNHTEFSSVVDNRSFLTTIIDPSIIGRFVRIANNQLYLQLAEVEVFEALQIVPTPIPTGVPEPITLSLLGAGLGGMTWMRRRRG